MTDYIPPPPPPHGLGMGGGGWGRCQIGQFSGGPYAACVMCVSFQADPFLASWVPDTGYLPYQPNSIVSASKLLGCFSSWMVC